MSEIVHCQRCQRDAAIIAEPTYPGALGEELRSTVCADCWSEWQRAEVMVINELRLNFMDPRAQQILIHHMREFLGLGSDAPG